MIMTDKKQGGSTTQIGFDLSVILPVYVEDIGSVPFIKERIDSYCTLASIYGGTEVIVMNDGSIPALGDSLDELETRWSNGQYQLLKVFHIPQAGDWTQSRAKNLGMQAAVGKKILLCDIDHVPPPITFMSILRMDVRENEAIKFPRRGMSTNQLLEAPPGIMLLSNHKHRFFHEQFSGHYGYEDTYFYEYHQLQSRKTDHIMLVNENLNSHAHTLDRDTERNSVELKRLRQTGEEPIVTKLEDVFNGYRSISNNEELHKTA